MAEERPAAYPDGRVRGSPYLGRAWVRRCSSTARGRGRPALDDPRASAPPLLLLPPDDPMPTTACLATQPLMSTMSILQSPLGLCAPRPAGSCRRPVEAGFAGRLRTTTTGGQKLCCPRGRASVVPPASRPPARAPVTHPHTPLSSLLALSRYKRKKSRKPPAGSDLDPDQNPLHAQLDEADLSPAADSSALAGLCETPPPRPAY